MRTSRYLPLADYGLIGDGHGAALVGRDGSIDWACLERFDRPAVFARLLDAERGGFWQIAPDAERADATIRYLGPTAVLETVHRSSEGSAAVRDVLLPPEEGRPQRTLVRACEGLSGQIELVSRLEPRPGYGAEAAALVQAGEELAFAADGLELRLSSTISQAEGEARFVLEQGERAAFVLGWGDGTQRPGDAEEAVAEALRWWEDWSEQCAYTGPYAEAVLRSAITLKLLTYDPSGAVVAAPTTSLPELVGAGANWDYRYTWLRDAALTVYAWLAIGQRPEGDAFFDWLCARVGKSEVADSGLNVMYDVDGGSDHEERELDHLEGYLGSGPVRVGNDACTQTQLDIHGHVLDVFASLTSWGRSDKLDVWPSYRSLADWTCAHWDEPDNGIWELRGPGCHHVYSKVMSWVALDRAMRAAERHHLEANVPYWAETAASIRHAVLEHGWNEELGAFKQSFEDERPDAANLLIPLVGFLPNDDPRVQANLARTESELTSGHLVYRFAGAPSEGQEDAGAFVVCSFWRVNALAAAGRLEEAAEAFASLLGRASPLGLFSEEIVPETGQLIGNVPQGFVHAALISGAVNLARAAGLGSAPAADDAPEGTAHLVPIVAGESL